MVIDLDAYPLWLILGASVVCMAAACEVGRWLGLRSVGQGGDDLGTLEGAILGLLALMIGFTFAMALSRYETRRDAVLIEANAIGTTALRARLLPAPFGADIRKLLQEYVQIRLDLARRGSSPAALSAAVAHANEMQENLWQQVKGLVAKDNAVVPTGLFIQTLNEMIDDQAKRLYAVSNRVPNIVLTALYAIAILACAVSGYANGLDVRRVRSPLYATGLVVALLILLIQDLDRPGAGFIRASQQPMIDVAAAIASHPD
jgi:hypothetical protein